MIKKLIIFLLPLQLLISCDNIETGNSIDNETVTLITDMGLLDEDEHILKYYSNFSKDKAGNFFTDKRIAHYWIDENDDSQTEISYAYYSDITAIDTTFQVPDFDIPYMTIWKKDSSKFRVFIDGTDQEERDFFEEAITNWKKNK